MDIDVYTMSFYMFTAPQIRIADLERENAAVEGQSVRRQAEAFAVQAALAAREAELPCLVEEKAALGGELATLKVSSIFCPFSRNLATSYWPG